MSKSYWTKHLKNTDDDLLSAGIYMNYINIELVVPKDDMAENKRENLFNDIKESVNNILDNYIKKHHE